MVLSLLGLKQINLYFFEETVFVTVVQGEFLKTLWYKNI